MKLVLTDVCKEIRKKTILSHISLELTSGNVYAFVGENCVCEATFMAQVIKNK